MAFYLMTFNPNIWGGTREDFLNELQSFRNGEKLIVNWSIQQFRDAGPDDYCFFLVQGTKNRGIFGRGKFVSEDFIDEKWDGSGKPEHYIQVEILNYEDYETPFISIDELYNIAPDYDWKPRNSGRMMDRQIGLAINQIMRNLGLMK